MDKNRKEKDILLMWGTRVHSDTDVFPQIDKTCQSYFEVSDSRERLTEYQFEGQDELKKYIEEIIGEDNRFEDIKQALFVAAIKNKPKQNELEKKMDNSADDTIPAYIYNF